MAATKKYGLIWLCSRFLFFFLRCRFRAVILLLVGRGLCVLIDALCCAAFWCFSCCTERVTANHLHRFCFHMKLLESLRRNVRLCHSQLSEQCSSVLKSPVCDPPGCTCRKDPVFTMDLCRRVLCHELCQTARVSMVTRPGSEKTHRGEMPADPNTLSCDIQ